MKDRFKSVSYTHLDVYKRQGHPARMAILEFLAKQDCCFFGDIHEELPIAKATVSQHLNCLLYTSGNGFIDARVKFIVLVFVLKEVPQIPKRGRRYQIHVKDKALLSSLCCRYI